MNARCLSLSLGLMIGLLGTSAAGAGVFKPNRLFIANADTDNIGLFDNGTVAGAPLGGTIDFPVGMRFGPDGLLYVTAFNSNEIYQIDSTGAVINSFGSSFIDSAGMLTFGANGRLYVVSQNNSKVIIFNTGGVKIGEFSTAADMATPVGIAVGPAGHIYLSDWTSGVIDEYDPSGIHLREFGSALGDPAGMTFGPDGRLYVTSQFNDSIKVLDAIGTEVGEIGAGTALNWPLTCVFGPDGNLWVSCQGTDEVLAYDLNGNLVNGIPAAAGLDHPTGLAFAPFHFKAKLSGRLGLAGQKLRLVKENVQLYISPGAQRLMLEVDSLPTPALSDFGNQFYVLHGFESYQAFNSKKRLFSGTEQYMFGFESGNTTVMVEVTGKLSNSGLYIPLSAKGTLQRHSSDGVLNAKLVTKKLIQ